MNNIEYFRVLESDQRRQLIEDYKISLACANRGDPVCQFLVAKAHYYGKAVPRSIEEVMKWLQKSAAQGHPEAQCVMGTRYSTGEGVKWSHDEAVIWWKKACTAGSPKAQFFMALCHIGGEGVPMDSERGLDLLKMSAEGQFAPAWPILASVLRSGVGCQPDPITAATWFSAEETRLDARANMQLGQLFTDGFSFRPNRDTSLRYFLRAYAMGHTAAGLYIGEALINSDIDSEQKEGHRLISESAHTAGHPYAYFLLGLCSELGLGTPRDQRQACASLKRAFVVLHDPKAGGSPPLGADNMRRKIDVHCGPSDYANDCELFEKELLEQFGPDHPEMIYQRAMNARSAAERISMLEKAAERGHPRAIYSLGQHHEYTAEAKSRDSRSYLVQPNFSTAIKFYKQAFISARAYENAMNIE